MLLSCNWMKGWSCAWQCTWPWLRLRLLIQALQLCLKRGSLSLFSFNSALPVRCSLLQLLSSLWIVPLLGLNQGLVSEAGGSVCGYSKCPCHFQWVHISRNHNSYHLIQLVSEFPSTCQLRSVFFKKGETNHQQTCVCAREVASPNLLHRRCREG